MIVTLADLVAPATQPSILQIELSIAQQLGLPTTAWQPLGQIRTVLAINSFLQEQYSGIVNLIAQGGYASLAATMVDSTGAPITTWMDLILSNNYNVLRVPVTYASGTVNVFNASTAPQSYVPGQLHWQNPATGATYTNTAAGTIVGTPIMVSPGAQPIAIAADAAWGGTIGTSGVGVTLVMLTPLPGITVGPLTTSLVGQSAESNGAALARAQNKLGTLSALGQLGPNAPPNPAGPNQAYAFVATSIPQAAVASAVWRYAVVTPITRVSVVQSTGVVVVYIANAAGQPSVGDTTAVNAAIQFLATPQAVTSIVVPATNLPIDVRYTVYVKLGGPLTFIQIRNNIAAALALYFASIPIGGVFTSAPNQLPLNEIVATIMNANPGTVDVNITSPSANQTLLPQMVPVLGVVSALVVFV